MSASRTFGDSSVDGTPITLAVSSSARAGAVAISEVLIRAEYLATGEFGFEPPIFIERGPPETEKLPSTHATPHPQGPDGVGLIINTGFVNE
jgi:hypothetical protein